MLSPGMEEELFVLEVIDMASPMGFSTTVERSDGTCGSGDAAIHVEDRFFVAMCKGMKVTHYIYVYAIIPFLLEIRSLSEI